MVSPGSNRIIIVDDDDAVRDSLEILLEIHDFSVVTFGSAHDFLASNAMAEGGCLLLDLHLPDMSGFDVLRQFDGMLKGTKVIMITARSDAATYRNALDAGAFTLLEKPFSDELLVDTIQKAMKSV